MNETLCHSDEESVLFRIALDYLAIDSAVKVNQL